MCGIVGYMGQRKAYPILIKGLKRLEYRGYDSAGVALINDDRQLNVYKMKGIAHTRWATHGEPCSANAHPHYSSSEKLALIHNGIIENYAVLKEKLQAKGSIFKSSTDTEVLVQLIEYMKVANQVSLLTAVRLALGEVIGAYAIHEVVVIASVTKGDTVISKIADYNIELPETIECLPPLITTVLLQLLAYHIAVCKEMDVDQPRNLAKSVTVE